MNSLSRFFPGSWTWSVGRVTQLSLLAVTVLAYSVLEMAIANSLFLTVVGAEQLPIVFILIGLCSLPSYILFSNIVDRYRRPRLFRFILGIAILMALGLRGLLTLDSPWVYYLLMVSVFFQWDFHNTLLYSSLLTDYFTAVEYKKYAPFIGIAQAIGMLAGGLLTTSLSLWITTENLLFFIPILLIVAIVQLVFLEQTQEQVESYENSSNVGVLEAIKTFPSLVQRYPLMLFLASSSFLLVIIYLTTEFLWFSVYAQHFTSDELTSFLGLIRIAVSFLQVVVLYCFTRPLLQWLGVARMNIVYPLTTLASLAGFLFNVNLSTSVGLHLNGDALYKSINIPVHQLNYNAIPREFIGRIRTLSDGVFYSLGLTIVGVLLWFAHNHLSLTEISWVALGLSIIFLILRLPMGKYYGSGLEKMIRNEAIDLDSLPKGSFPGNEQSILLAKEFLAESADLHSQLQGLELAKEIGTPLVFLEDIKALDTLGNHDLRQKISDLFSGSIPSDHLEKITTLLNDPNPLYRELALELLIANQFEFETTELKAFLNDPNPIVRILASALMVSTKSEQVYQDRLQGELSEAEGNALIRVTLKHPSQTLIHSVIASLPHSNLTVNGLKALKQLAAHCDRSPLNIARPYVNHPDPWIRTAAFDLLEQTHTTDSLTLLHKHFGDEDFGVRLKIASIVPKYGEAGAAIAQESLSSSDPNTIETAIAALGQMSTKRSTDQLFAYLTPDFESLSRSRKWQRNFPLDEPAWAMLSIALEDFQQRLIQKVLYVLSCLGHAKTVAAVNRALGSNNSRDRANAIEVLSSLKDRRFIRPLLPLLEESTTPQTPPKNISGAGSAKTKGYKILLEALAEKDRWIRMAALVALASIPQALIKDPDPLVRTAAYQVFQTAEVQLIPNFMNRILLLKKVPIFKNLTLDELQLISESLESEQVIAQNAIYEEGSWGHYFYLIESGEVDLIKLIQGQSHSLKKLTVGDYFGELSLFDDSPRWDGAIADKDCKLLKLEKSKFKSLMIQRPHISLEICRFLSQRLREYDQFRSVETAQIQKT